MKFPETIVNKVAWPIETRRCALLLHDMQPHYLAALDEPTRNGLIANARRLLQACAVRNIPIFASQVPSVRDGRERGLMLDMWGMGPPLDGSILHPALEAGAHVIQDVRKRSYSTFFANDFETMLRRHGCDSLLICGVFTSIGCQCTAMDAFMRDIRPFAVADALADFNPEDHRMGLANMARLCARIVDTDDVLTCLEAG